MTWFDVKFPDNKTGLGTVGVTEYDNTGTISVARTTAGVVELESGGYGRDWTLDPSTVTLVWDTGEATPLHAQESLTTYLAVVAGGGGGGGLTLEEFLALRGF